MSFNGLYFSLAVLFLLCVLRVICVIFVLSVLCCSMLFYAVLCCSVLFYVVLYCSIPFYVVLCCSFCCVVLFALPAMFVPFVYISSNRPTCPICHLCYHAFNDVYVSVAALCRSILFYISLCRSMLSNAVLFTWFVFAILAMFVPFVYISSKRPTRPICHVCYHSFNDLYFSVAARCCSILFYISLCRSMLSNAVLFAWFVFFALTAMYVPFVYMCPKRSSCSIGYNCYLPSNDVYYLLSLYLFCVFNLCYVFCLL